jgi:hypothetical protein
MARPTKNPVFVFQSADNRGYFIKTQLPASAQYTVYAEPSSTNPGVTWFYLKLKLTDGQ